MFTTRTRGLGVIAAGALVLAPAWPGSTWTAVAPLPTVVEGAATVGAGNWEHSYRLGGKVWILFWISRDDVGTARLSRRTTATSSTISFIGGSDPRRAPGHLNQWGVAIEDATDDRASVFVVRTISPDDLTAPERHLVDPSPDALFGAACSSIERNTSRSSVTGVYADPDMTFRSVSTLLDLVGASTRWESTVAERPADVYPGFFNVVLSGITETVARARRGILAPAVPHRLYLFKGTLYDIYFKKIEAAGPALLRQKFGYRNRKTGDSGDFTITFGTEGALTGVPVEVAFQPSWWLRVHLRLDDSADVPADPSRDTALASRIDAICDAVLAGGVERSHD